MQEATCPTCAFARSDDDNFCRNCGAAVADNLPVVASRASITVWKPQASPVVKGAAVMAAGTIGQFLVRRAVGALISGASRPRRPRAVRIMPARNDGMVDDTQIITETIMMRRVRIRRPA